MREIHTNFISVARAVAIGWKVNQDLNGAGILNWSGNKIVRGTKCADSVTVDIKTNHQYMYLKLATKSCGSVIIASVIWVWKYVVTYTYKYVVTFKKTEKIPGLHKCSTKRRQKWLLCKKFVKRKRNWCSV